MKLTSHILKEKAIYDFLDSANERLLCKCFFDDWFLYAVPNDCDYTYSLLKLREQEHDAEEGAPAGRQGCRNEGRKSRPASRAATATAGSFARGHRT